MDAVDNTARYLFLKNYGLYKSTDRGVSWTFVNTGLPNYGAMAADSALCGSLWVGTCCSQPVGLSHSTDGGVTWTNLAGFVNVTDLDAASNRVAVLGQRIGDTYDKVYYSADGGGVWGEITRPGHRFGNALAVAVDPWRPGTVWISTNGRSVARFTQGVPKPDLITQLIGGNFVTSFTQPADASGVTYLVEWSLTLAPGDWTAVPDTGVLPQHVFSVPTAGQSQMFMRLKVIGP